MASSWLISSARLLELGFTQCPSKTRKIGSVLEAWAAISMQWCDKMSTAVYQSAAFNMRLRRRSRQFASELTIHAPGQTIIGADQFGGNYTSGAMFVASEVDGLPWVALDSGTSGATPLRGNGPVMSDGSINWLQWSGLIRSAPPTPA
jgi:hypothetical protein